MEAHHCSRHRGRHGHVLFTSFFIDFTFSFFLIFFLTPRYFYCDFTASTTTIAGDAV